MKSTRSTAENIRPIIQAMERSIESARRRRLHHTDEPPTATRTEHQQQPVSDASSTMPARRKARPKRPSPMINGL